MPRCELCANQDSCSRKPKGCRVLVRKRVGQFGSYSREARIISGINERLRQTERAIGGRILGEG